MLYSKRLEGENHGNGGGRKVDWKRGDGLGKGILRKGLEEEGPGQGHGKRWVSKATLEREGLGEWGEGDDLLHRMECGMFMTVYVFLPRG